MPLHSDTEKIRPFNNWCPFSTINWFVCTYSRIHIVLFYINTYLNTLKCHNMLQLKSQQLLSRLRGNRHVSAEFSNVLFWRWHKQEVWKRHGQRLVHVLNLCMLHAHCRAFEGIPEYSILRTVMRKRNTATSVNRVCSANGRSFLPTALGCI